MKARNCSVWCYIQRQSVVCNSACVFTDWEQRQNFNRGLSNITLLCLDLFGLIYWYDWHGNVLHLRT